MSASFLSKVLAGQRRVSLGMAQQIADRLGLRVDFFTGPGGNYRQYRQKKPPLVFGGEEKLFFNVLTDAKKLTIAHLSGTPIDLNVLDTLPDRILALRFVALAKAAAEAPANDRRSVALDLARTLAVIPLVDVTTRGLIAAGLAQMDDDEEPQPLLMGTIQD